MNAPREQRLRVELPAVLSLGSNLGDREATLRQAVADIAAIPGVRVTAASGIVETDAVKPDGVDTDVAVQAFEDLRDSRLMVIHETDLADALDAARGEHLLGSGVDQLELDAR